MSDVRSGEGGPPPAEGPPPPSPLTGAYLLIVLPQLHSDQHKDRLLHALTKGLITWDIQDCHVDLDKELQTITSQAPEGEEAKNGERLIQFASENLVTEVLIHPQLNTLVQCMKNCLSSFTRHRHIIHAGYSSTGNGAWILQDGTFSLSDFADIYVEPEVQRVLRAYEGTVSVDVHCSSEGDWWALKAKDPFSKVSRVRLNPPDKGSASESVREFLSYLSGYLRGADLQELLQSSDVVGNIRFSHPTLYVFPGGQGDAALFGINGFNMLVDGGFSRKSCFWDFTRHLDRLDSVLMTRINNGNFQGLGSLLRRKQTEQVYPQIGHFFCNVPDRKQILSPDGDKDRDPLRVSLMEEGQEMLTSLRSLGLRPQSCYRESFVEPLNLYHKVGHGKLDMYVLSPAKDSREVREFLAKWVAVDSKIFCSYSRKGEFNFPLSSKTSICALLVWQPANPEDNITRLLFPGSTPQQKIFEGLDRLKTLEFMKHPTCTGKSLSPTSSTLGLSIKAKPKAPIIEKMDTEKKQIEPTKAVKQAEAKPKALPPKPKPKLDRPKETKPKTDLDINKPETVKIDKKPEAVQKEKEIKKEKPKRPIQKSAEKKPQKPPEKKTESVKSSPTTPKKTVENKLNEISGKIEQKPRASKSKASPSATPAKSAKEANNRKVVELKSKEVRPQKPGPAKKDEPKRTDKPAAKKTTGAPKSPVKVTRPGAKQKLDVKKQVKNDKDITTDSSAVSTPSTVDAELIKIKEDAEKPKESEESKPLNDRKDSEDKGKSISKEEEDEILIIEKVEISNEITGTRDVESINVHLQKIDEEKSQKVKAAEMEEKENGEKTLVESTVPALPDQVQDEVQDIIESAAEIVSKTKEIQKIDSLEISGKDLVSTDKLVTPKDKELKSAETLELKVADESQPDEKFSTTVESGATTTAPTLPEDERIPLDEIKEGVEEKHVKEETKEKEVITVRPEQPTSLPQVPVIAGTAFDQRAQLLKDIVKTPDEVADLPVHEEVDMEIYEGSLPLPAVKRDRKDESTEELKFIKDGLEKEDKNKDLREDLGESVDVYSHTTTDLDFVSSSPKSGKQLAESTEEKEELEEKMDESKEKHQKKEELIQKAVENKDDVADKTPVLEDIQKIMDDGLAESSVAVKQDKIEESFETPAVQEKGEPSITKIVEKELSEKTEKEMKVQLSKEEVQKESEIIEKEVKPSELKMKATVLDEIDWKEETKMPLEEMEKDQIEQSDKLKLEKLMDETVDKTDDEIKLKDELVVITKKREDYGLDLGKEELLKNIPSKDEKGMELSKDEMDIGKADEKQAFTAASKVENGELAEIKVTEKEVLSEIEAPQTEGKGMEKEAFAEEKRLEKETLSEERRLEKEVYAEERRLEKEALAEERRLEKEALAVERKLEKEALAEERKLEKEALAEERKLEKEALAEERKLETVALAEGKKMEEEAYTEQMKNDKDAIALEEIIQKVVLTEETKIEKETLADIRRVEEKGLEEENELEKAFAQDKKVEIEAHDAEEKLDKEVLGEEKKSEKEALYEEKKLEKIVLVEEMIVGKEAFAVEGTAKKEVMAEEIKTEKETITVEEIVDKEPVAKEETMEKQTLAEEKRLEKEALDEERKLEKEAFAEERRLEKEAYAEERKLEKEAIAEERRLEKEALAEERKLEKQALAEEKEREKEAIAEERKIEKEAKVEKERVDIKAVSEENEIKKEARAGEKRVEKEVVAEEKKIEKEAFAEEMRVEKEAVAEEKKIEKEALAEDRSVGNEAVAEEREVEKEALAKENKLEKEALAEERNLEKVLVEKKKIEKEAVAEEKKIEKEVFTEEMRVEKEALAEKKVVEKEALSEEKKKDEEALAEETKIEKGGLKVETKVEKEGFAEEKIEKKISEKQIKEEDKRKESLDKGEATILENGFDTKESKIELTKDDIFKAEDKKSEEASEQLEMTLEDEDKKQEITEKSEVTVAKVNDKKEVAEDSKFGELAKDETEDKTTVKAVSLGGKIDTDEGATTHTIKVQEREAELEKIDEKPLIIGDIKETPLPEKPCDLTKGISEQLLTGKSVEDVAKSVDEEVSHDIAAAISEEEIGNMTLAEGKRLEEGGIAEETRLEKETLAEERKREKEAFAEERKLEKVALAEERKLEKEAIAEERRLEKEAFAEERRLEKETIAEERRVEKEALAEERKLEKEALAEERKLEKEALVVERKLEKEELAEESKLKKEELAEESKLEKQKLVEESKLEKEKRDEEKSVEKELIDEKREEKRGFVEKPQPGSELETKGIKEEVLQGAIDGTKDGDGTEPKDEHTTLDRDGRAEEKTIGKEMSKTEEKITSEIKELDLSKLTETSKTPEDVVPKAYIKDEGEPLSPTKDSESNISLESKIYEKTGTVETKEKTEKPESDTKSSEEAIIPKSDEKVVESSKTEKEQQAIVDEKPSLKEVEKSTDTVDKELEKKAVESSKEKISSEEKESDDQEISKKDLSTKLDDKASTNVLSQEEEPSLEVLENIEKSVEDTRQVSQKSDEKVTEEKREFLSKAENEGKDDDIKRKEETESLKDIKEKYISSKEEQFEGVVKETLTKKLDAHDITAKPESIAEITKEEILPKPSHIAREEPILKVEENSFGLQMEKHLVQRDDISPKESLLTYESKLEEVVNLGKKEAPSKKDEGLEKLADVAKLGGVLKSGKKVDETLEYLTESDEKAEKSVNVPKKEESKTEEKTGDIAKEDYLLKSDEKLEQELGAENKSQKVSDAAVSQESEKSVEEIEKIMKDDMPILETSKVDMRTDSAKDEDITKTDGLGKPEEKLEKQADADMRKLSAKLAEAEGKVDEKIHEAGKSLKKSREESTDVKVKKMESEFKQDDKVEVTKVTDTQEVKSEEHLDKQAADELLAKDEMEKDTDDDKPAAKLDLGTKREDKVQSDESRHFEEKIIEKETLAEERRAEKEALAEERKQEKETFAEERRLEKEAFAEERRLEKEAIAEERRLEKETIAEERRLEKEELAEERRLEKEAIAEERNLEKVAGEKSEGQGKQRDSDEITEHKEIDEVKFEKQMKEVYDAAKDVEAGTHLVDIHLKGSAQFGSKEDAKDTIQVLESEEKKEGETTRTDSGIERKLSISAERKPEEKTEVSLDKKDGDIKEDILKLESKEILKEDKIDEAKEETQGTKIGERLASQGKAITQLTELKPIDEIKLITKEFLDEAQGIKQKEMDACDILSKIEDSKGVLEEAKNRKESLICPDIVTIKDEQLGSSKADKKEGEEETTGFETKIDEKAFSEMKETPFKGEAKTGKEIDDKYSKVKSDISVTQSHLAEKEVLGAQETDKNPIVTKETEKDKVEGLPSGEPKGDQTGLTKPAEKVDDISSTKREETQEVCSKICESESDAVSIAESTKVNGLTEAQKLEESFYFTTTVEGKVEDEHKKDSSEVFISKATVVSQDDKVEFRQTALETGTISGKGEKDNVNADLKSKMVEEKQGSADEKLSSKVEGLESHLLTETISGESSSQITKCDTTGEAFKVTNGKVLSGSLPIAQESTGQKETDLGSAVGTSYDSIVKKETVDISNGKSDEIKDSSVPKLTSTIAIGKSEELGSATGRKGSNGTSEVDKKSFCAVSCSEPKKTRDTDFSLECSSSKDETMCKVEKIVTEKHEIESVKDVSVVKGKLISDVGDVLNGASAHSSSEKITNGSGPSHTVTTVRTIYTKDIPGTSGESCKVITEIPEGSPLHKLLSSKFESCEVSSLRESLSGPRGSLEATPEGRGSPASDASALGWRESDDDLPASPLSTTSHLHSPPPVMFSSTIRYSDDDSDTSLGRPDVDFDSALREHQEARLEKRDPIEKWDKPLGLPPPPPRRSSPVGEWGRPLRLPSPAPPREEENNDDTSGSAKTTPKKVAKMNEENNRLASNITLGKEANNKNRRSDSPVKRNTKEGRKTGMNHIYLDLSYVPHHGNSHYANVEFFKRIRARYYVFSGTEPSKEVFNALLEAKQTWEDKDLEVTIIPSYDTDTLGYWIAENEELLSKYKIDLSPSASRCTINLQDHDTSCSAYRLEF